MKIFDLHVHTSRANLNDPEAFIGKLGEAGVYGAGVFSLSPEGLLNGAAYEERVSTVLAFCKDYPGRLFPVLWIHPHEDGAIEKARDAAARGVAGFKIICNNFYVYDDKSMALLNEIAKLKKPVCFHSGILWDGTSSGNYNRPCNWEYLLDIPGLRFSLAHCSWPWYDECIAVYGKFQNAYQTRPEAAEMFLDLTPGTPVPYRRDLITKLFTVGYDVKHNIMFGTDCSTDYHTAFSKQWQDIDNGLYHEVGVGEETKRHIYHDNFLRFLGVSGKAVTKAALTSDGR